MKTIRTKKDILNHPGVHSIHYEGDEGWWIHLKEGYISPEMECRTIHERTIAELIPYVNNIKKID